MNRVASLQLWGAYEVTQSLHPYLLRKQKIGVALGNLFFWIAPTFAFKYIYHYVQVPSCRVPSCTCTIMYRYVNAQVPSFYFYLLVQVCSLTGALMDRYAHGQVHSA